MGRQTKSLAQRERDAALARVSRARRWMLVAATGLTAAFAALVSAIAHGHSLGAKSRAAPSVRSNPVPRKKTSNGLRMPPLASAGALGLQSPTSAPQPAPQAPQPQAAPNPPAAAPVPAPVSGGS